MTLLVSFYTLLHVLRLKLNLEYGGYAVNSLKLSMISAGTSYFSKSIVFTYNQWFYEKQCSSILALQIFPRWYQQMAEFE